MRLSQSEDIEVVDGSGRVKKVVTSDNGSYFETVAWSSGGVSPSTITNHGVSFVNMTGTDPSTSVQTLTLARPAAGVRKTIVVDSTAAYINTISIDLTTDVTLTESTNTFILFSTLATVPQVLELIGVSTSQWAVLGVNSTVGVYSVATGIRSATAAHTS